MIEFLGYYLLFGLLWAAGIVIGNWFASPRDRANAMQIILMCVAAVPLWAPFIVLMVVGMVRDDSDNQFWS
jgi:hypothetical protein